MKRCPLSKPYLRYIDVSFRFVVAFDTFAIFDINLTRIQSYIIVHLTSFGT